MSASWANTGRGQRLPVERRAADELFNAVRVVDRGGSLLQPVVASRLMGICRSRSGPKR